MKHRIYRGMIYGTDGDEKYLEGINLNDDHLFIQNGYWVASNRTVGSYQLCDCYGQAIEEFEHLQFSRTRENMFYLESV